jgi:hypothetical protein
MPENNNNNNNNKNLLSEINYYANLTPRSYTLYGQKKSQYDEGFIVPQLDREAALAEYRAQTQPWYDKLANSTAKGVALAGTTFTDTFAGSLAGIINAAGEAGKITFNNKDDDNVEAAKQILNAFVDNPISKALNSFNEFLESDVLVNYRTKREIDNAWYENAIGMGGVSGLTNFWGDDVLKNTGFLVGGMGGAKTIGSLLSKAVKLETKRKSFQSIQDAVKGLAQGVDISEANLNKLAREARNAAGTYATESKKVMEDIEKVGRSVRRTENGIQIAASTLGSLGEARIEALGNAEAFKNQELQKINYKLQSGQITPEEANKEIAELDKKVRTYQNVSFLTNTVLLSGSNYLGWRNTFLKPYDLAKQNRLLDVVGDIKQGYKGVPKERYMDKLLKSTLRESQEEQLQYVIQEGTKEYVNERFDGNDIFSSIFQAGAKGFEEAYGSEEGWESAVIGAIFGSGAFALTDSYKDYKKQLALEQNAIDAVNKYKQVTDLGYKLSEFHKENNLDGVENLFYDMMVRDTNLKYKENQALDNDDRFAYEGLKNKKFFNMVNAFYEAGKIEDLIDIIKAETELNEDELRSKYVYLPEGKENKKENYISYFAKNKSGVGEASQYIKDKANKAITEIQNFKKLKENLESLYQNTELTINGPDDVRKKAKIFAKDYLSELYWLGETRDNRINSLKPKLIKYQEDGMRFLTVDETLSQLSEKEREELFKDNELLKQIYNEENGVIDFGRLEEILKDRYSKDKSKIYPIYNKRLKKQIGIETPMSLKNALENFDKDWEKLYNALNAWDQATKKGEWKITKEGKYEFQRDRKSIIQQAIFLDFMRLLQERRNANFALIQLSNNRYTDLVKQIQKNLDKKVSKQSKKSKKDDDDDEKWQQLINRAKAAGYTEKNSPVVYFRNTNTQADVNTGQYPLLMSVFKDGKRIVVNPYNNVPRTIRDKNDKTGKTKIRYDLFNKENMRQIGFDNIEFVPIDKAEAEIQRNKLNENNKAIINSMIERNSQLKTILEQKSKQLEQNIADRKAIVDEIDSIKKALELRQQGKYVPVALKRLGTAKYLKSKLQILNEKLNKLNNEIQELEKERDTISKDINTFDEFISRFIKNPSNRILKFIDIQNEVFEKVKAASIETYTNTSLLIKELEDERKKIIDIIQDLEYIINSSDITVKSLFLDLDRLFESKWINEIGLDKIILNKSYSATDEELNKRQNIIDRKLKEYSEKTGIPIEELHSNLLKDIDKLQSATKSFEELSDLENNLAINKTKLESLNKKIEDLTKEKNRIDYLVDLYIALNNNLADLSTIYERFVNKYNSILSVDNSQRAPYKYKQLYDDTDQDFIDYEINFLSNAIFRTTGSHAINTKENGIYEDERNEDGTIKLNDNPHSLRYIKFVNNKENYKKLNVKDNDKSEFIVRVFKYNSQQAIDAGVNEQFKENLGDTKENERGDFFAVIYDKNTNKPVLANDNGEIDAKGNIVFQALPVFVKSNPKAMINFVGKLGYVVINQQPKLAKIDVDGNVVEQTLPGKYSIQKQGSDKINEFDSEEQLIENLKRLTNSIYSNWIKSIDEALKEGTVYLNISSTNRGIRANRVDKDGRILPTDNLKETLIKARGQEFTKNGRLSKSNIIIIENNELSKRYGLPLGRTIIELDSGEIIPLNQTYLSNDDVKIIIALLEKVIDSKVSLGSISLSLPEGNYIKLGGEEKTELPIFGKGHSYSIINAITMWGQGGDPNYSIYIENNKLHFGAEVLSLKDAVDYNKNSNLINFLTRKKHNINKALLNSNSNYFHPEFDEKGNIVFKKYLSYEDYLFTNNKLYSTIYSSNNNNYTNSLIFLSRNLIFENDSNNMPKIIKNYGKKPDPKPSGENPINSTSKTPTNNNEFKGPFVENKLYKFTKKNNIVVLFKNNSFKFVSTSLNTEIKEQKDLIDGLIDEFNRNLDELGSDKFIEIINAKKEWVVTEETDPEEEAKKQEDCNTGNAGTTGTTKKSDDSSTPDNTINFEDLDI